MARDETTGEAATRRDTIRDGSTVIGRELLAGCVGDGDGKATPTATETTATDDALSKHEQPVDRQRRAEIINGAS